ncbi:hypothetical protein, partial [Streptomyces sp. CRB46]|uniref:hypothetical protein n=1 Tax=Streptomyces sp. CRB46 TaxID=2682613 RepID=UPI001F26A1F2
MRGVGAQPGATGVPLRPPVPPQRHDCPQLRLLRLLRRGGAAGRRPPRAVRAPRVRVAAYGGEGAC